MQNKSPQSAMNRPSMDAMNRLLRILLLSSVFHVISAQTGFLSIDCGANESYVDSVTKIQWVPDIDYTNSGLKSTVANQNVSKELRTLRYFPNSSISNCYVMPISTDQKYFFRAMFLYGNYDAKNHWPSFNLSFDAGNWTHELVGTDYSSNQTISVELIFPAKQSSNVSLCFSSNDPIKDVPFISSLELRPLPANSYQDETYFADAYLQLRVRTYFNRAANSILTFPYDKYDREWVAPSSIPSFANLLSSNITIDTTRYNNEPPIQVLRSALEGKNDSVFNYTLNLEEVDSDLLFYFYFLELSSKRKASDVREFDMVISSNNNVTRSITMTIKPNETWTAWFWGTWGTSKSTKVSFSFVPTMNSTLPPILNAFEIFTYNKASTSTLPSPPSPSQPPPNPFPPPPFLSTPPPSSTPPPPVSSSTQHMKIKPLTLCFILAILVKALI